MTTPTPPTVAAERRGAIRLTLPNERAPGWNSTLRGHWTKREDLIDWIWYSVGSALPDHYQLFDRPVDVQIVATFKGTPLDSDNICAKLYIDALKGRLLREDDARYVRRVTTESKRGKHNQVEITLTEANP